MTKLSVNINKVATLRNARGGNNPDLLKVAKDIQNFGADSMQDNNPGGSSSEGSEVSASTIQVVAGITLFSAAAFGIKQWFDARGGKLF